MPFTIVRQDITKMHVDAIVNAANTELQMGGGVCGAIFKAAGPLELQAACDKLTPIQTGDAVITPGFALTAKFVVHAAGPVYHQWGKEQNENHLSSCYIKSLELAAKNGCESIAFPLISSGIYGYPKDEALSVATSAITGWAGIGDMNVYLAVFDAEAFAVSTKLLGDVKSYIDENYVDVHEVFKSRLRESRAKNYTDDNDWDEFASDIEEIEEECKIQALTFCESIPAVAESIDDLVENLDESFSDTLLRIIDAKDRTDIDVYKSANIDRKLFSKIRSGNGYIPSKKTAVALAIALKLTIEETDDLLEKAGYALSNTQKFDVIVKYFIVNGKYDIYEINEVLFKYDQHLLGS